MLFVHISVCHTYSTTSIESNGIFYNCLMVIFIKIVYKIQGTTIYDKTNCYFMLSPINIYEYIWTNSFNNFKIPDRVC